MVDRLCLRHRSALPQPSGCWRLAVPALADEIMLPREPQLGPRPFYLVDNMEDGPLKSS